MILRFLFSVLLSALKRYNNQWDWDGQDGIEHPLPPPPTTSESECPIESVGEDGVLCSILSKLTLREAATTSVLSSRWRSLWNQIPYLDFSAYSMMEPYAEHHHTYLFSLDFREQKLILGTRADWFVRSVDDVLRHRPAMGVKYFGVRFRLLKEHTPYINRWLSFAINSGAQVLVLDFFETNFHCYEQEERYEFPYQLFTSGSGSGSGSGRGSSLERLYVTYCTLRLPEQFTGFASLKELGLANLYISDTDIKNILSACSNLQHMHLFRCHRLTSLYISQPSGQMKSLVVHDCIMLELIEFSGISLKMFDYRGHQVTYTFMNAARVVGLSIKIYEKGCRYFLTDLPKDFRHLEKVLAFSFGSIEAARIPASYKFPHLKHLEMSIDISSKDGFIALASILNAAPLVETFHLKLTSIWKKYMPGTRMWPTKCIHEHLKQLKISGFRAAQEEIEFVLDVVKSAIMLESIILDPYIRIYLIKSDIMLESPYVDPYVKMHTPPEGRVERAFCPPGSPPELSRERACKYLNGNIGDIKLVIL